MRTKLLFLILLALAGLVGPAGAPAARAAAPRVLASGALTGLGDAGLIFRTVDLTLDPSDPVVTHKHGAGMTYALDGPHALTLDGQSHVLQPGEAAWVPDQALHSHATDGRTPTHFLFMYLWPASKKGAPLAPGFRNAQVAFESDVLAFPARQAQDVSLTDQFFAPGETGAPQTYAGPVMLAVLAGKFQVTQGGVARSAGAGDYLAVQAGTSLQLAADASGPGHVLVLAIVAAGQPPTLPALPLAGGRRFPETGQSTPGLFLRYWQANGGLMQQGYPIAGLQAEASDLDGRVYSVQYFERALLEYHPENAGPFQVLGAQLGTFQYRHKYPQGGADQQANQTAGQFFPETGHWIGGRFWTYWRSHGGLLANGYPISDEFREVSALDGQSYTVQYFERAELELHPENAAPFDILAAQLGTFQYGQRYPHK